MPRCADDDWADDETEWDGDDGDEFGAEDDDEPTVPCPHCGTEVHEDAQQCPHCERYISAEDAPPARKPWWIIIGAVVCLYVVARWIAG